MDFNLMLLITGACGVVIGFGLAYFSNRNKATELNMLKGELAQVRDQLSAARREAELKQESLTRLEERADKMQSEFGAKSEEVARVNAEKSGLQEKIETYQKDLAQMQEQFRKDFENLANKIFDEKTEKFTKQNKLSLDQVLVPLKDRIIEFQKKVEDSHTERIKETTGLRSELKQLKEMSQKMTTEAENLTKALKNDSKAQGNWGEMILETILQGSGLARDREYFLQKSFTTDEGRRLQPDVLIKLPDDKWVVVDSKVSLTAYEKYNSAEEEAERERYLKEHLVSIRTHFRALAEKRYNELSDGKNLDFTLMFVPIEPAYLTALSHDQSLFNDAYERGVVMVSPSTLVASLKIIASTWKHEYQNRNAQEIAKRGKLLLEKFVGFTEDFEKIGDQIKRTNDAYGDAHNKLTKGKGNLISQSQQLQDLGVKSKKQISATLSDSGDA